MYSIMKKSNKLIIVISIAIIVILFVVMFSQHKPSKKKCASFFSEKSSHAPSELIRQVTLKFECDIEPKFKVDKYIYDDIYSEIIQQIYIYLLVLICLELDTIIFLCKVFCRSPLNIYLTMIIDYCIFPK